MGGSRSITVTLETVTPLFLGGAYPKGVPELRPSSFRGVMRYWLRAALGAHMEDKDLRRTESAVFGSTERASPVIVRIQGKPHYTELERRPGRTSGYNYLYWLAQPKSGNLRCIASGSAFRVCLSLRPGVFEEQTLWLSGAALWLTVRIGGLGSRSRRALGSLITTQGPAMDLDSPLPSFVSTSEDAAALAIELTSGLKTLRGIIGRSDGKPSRKFNVLHRDRCSIWVVAEDKLWATWEDAAEKMGTALQSLRRSLPRRQKASLGLPFKGAPRDLRNSYSRYASPLILTLAPLRSGDLVGIVVMFEPIIETTSDFRNELVRPFIEQFDVREEVSL